MRWLAFILSLVVVASVEAATCYESDCRVDDDGTIWCYNQQVDCPSSNCISCADATVPAECEECADQFSIIECFTTGDRSVMVSYAQRDSDDWDTYPCPVGASVEGEEDDPGSWGRRTHYSTVRGWYHVEPEPGANEEL